MAAQIKQILTEALTLPPADKAMLAHCLIASLDEMDETDTEAAWLRLAIRRDEELERGEVAPVSWEDLKSRIRGR